MLSPTTHLIFTRNLAAWRNPRHPAATTGMMLASERARHAEYEALYTAAHDALQAMEPARRPLRALARLGAEGCLSGSYEFRATTDELRRCGIDGANNIFAHDRAALAQMFDERRAA